MTIHEAQIYLEVDLDGWEASLIRLFKRTFPDRPLPYPSKELNELIKFFNIEHPDNIRLFQIELMQLAYETLVGLRYRETVKPSDIRKEIDRSVIKPVDALLRGIELIKRLGAEEAYALAFGNDTFVNIDQLAENLSKFRAWSELAKEKTREPSVQKGITEVRQDFVNRLYKIFHGFSGKAPSRSPQADDDGIWHEDSEFSRFVDLCAAPLFPQKYNFTRQIRNAQQSHIEWLAAGQKPAQQ